MNPSPSSDLVINRSGVVQVFYTKAGVIRRIPPGDTIEMSELEELGDGNCRDMIGILARPKVPRRPLPSMSRLVGAMNAPGTFVEISIRPTDQNREAYFREQNLVSTNVPEFLPGWLRWLAAPSGSNGRWSLSSAFGKTLPSGGDGPRGKHLVSSMRAVLRGEKVRGLSLSEKPTPVGKKIPLVVLCVHNAPRWTVDCIASLVSDSDRPEFDLVVIDDGSVPAARDAVAASLNVGDPIVDENGSGTSWRVSTPSTGINGFYYRRDTAQGYLRTANLGASLYDSDRHDIVVFLNSDTVVGRGWLRSLRRSLYSSDDIAAANPISNNNVNYSVVPPAGADPDSISDALLATHNGKYPEVIAPSGFCLAIRGEVWEKYGPYDEQQWGTGYGEETDIMLAARKDGWRHVLASDSYVHHAKSMSHGKTDGNTKSHDAFERIKRKYGSWFLGEARRLIEDSELANVRNRIAAISRLPGSTSDDPRKNAAWFVKTSNLCGGVYACVYLSDALRRRGWDSRVVTVYPRDADMYDNVSPITVFDGESDIRRSFDAEVFTDGFLISASWVTAPATNSICDRSDGVVPVLFIQDDERRFESNGPYKRLIETAWEEYPKAIANSQWVAEAVEEYLGPAYPKPEVVNVGFDPLVFFPRPREESSALRVIALARSETTHRGTDILYSAIEKAKRLGVPIDLRLFGTRPSRHEAPSHTYLGRIAHHELAPHVAAADVLVDPSRFQGFGLDAVQALASGTALLCTDNLGCHEYAKDGENSVIVECSSDAIAEGLKRLHEDRSLLSKIQEAGPSSVEHLSWDVLAEQWERYLLNETETK